MSRPQNNENLMSLADQLLWGMQQYGVSTELFGATAYVGFNEALEPKVNYFLCDGTADQVEMRNAAVYVDALGGGDIKFEWETYTLTAQLVLEPNIIYDFGNAIIYWDTTTFTYPIVVAGTLGSGSLLTVNADIMDYTITVADGGVFSVDDYVLLHSEAQTYGQSSKDGEIHRVESIAGNAITLFTPIDIDYLIADTATLTVVNMATNVTIRGGTLEGNGADDFYGVQFTYAASCLFEDFKSSEISETGIQLTSCVDTVIERFDQYRAEDPGSGYGILLQDACSNITINEGTFTKCKHSIAMGSTVGNYGTTRYPTISNCTFKGGMDTVQINSHDGTGSNTLVIGCKFFNALGTGSAAAIGFNGRSITVVACICYGGNGSFFTTQSGDVNEIFISACKMYGGRWFCDSISTTLTLVKLDDCITLNIIRAFCRLQSSVDTTIEITNCHADVMSTSSGEPGIHIRNACKSFKLQNSTITNALRSSVEVEGALGGIISGNEISNSNTDGGGGVGTSEALILEDCTKVLVTINRFFDDQGTETQRVGVIETGSSDGNTITNNEYYGNTVSPVVIIGPNTVLDTIPFQFTKELNGTYLTTSPTGIEVDANTEGAILQGHIRQGVHQVVRIRIFAVALDGPIGGGGQMHLEITFNAGAMNAAYNTAGKSWTLADHDSEEADYVANDAISWVVEDADVANELLALAALDKIELIVTHEAGAAPDGATDAVFGSMCLECV